MTDSNKISVKSGSGGIQFFFMTIAIFLFAIYVVAIGNFYLPFLGEYTDPQSSILSFLFTLPVTFAAAYVVVLLGERMNSLAENSNKVARLSEARELYSDCKTRYLEYLKLLSKLERELLTMRISSRNKLFQLEADRLFNATLSEEEWENLAYEYGPVITGEDENGEPEYENQDNPSELKLKSIVNDVVEESKRVRVSLVEMMEFILHEPFTLGMVRDASANECSFGALASLKEYVALGERRISEYDEKINDPNIAEFAGSFKRIKSDRLELLKALRFVIGFLEKDAGDKNSFQNSLEQLKFLLIFSLEEEASSDILNAIFNDYLEDLSTADVTVHRLFSHVIFPLMIQKPERNWVEEEHDFVLAHPSKQQKIDAISFSVNQVCVLAIEDLRRCWPTKHDLIQDSMRGVVDVELREMVENMMMDSLPPTASI